MKPEYKSYIRRQFSRYPYIVKSETGDIFKEINGEKHKFTFSIIAFTLAGLSGTISYFSFEPASIQSIYLSWLIIYPIVTVSIIVIARLICTRIFYKVSRFEIIDERELDKYSGMIQSLQRAEARRKNKKH